MRGVGTHGENIEAAIENALAPGCFIDWDDDAGFCLRLDEVRREIQGLVDRDEAVHAAELLESFAAGCHAKADEVDDSSGMFGAFAREILADWIRARQAADADPAETAVTLVGWMEADEYGFLNGVEDWAVEALDWTELEAFDLAVRIRSESEDPGEWFPRQALAIRKAILARRCAVDEYAALCEETDGLLPHDCGTLADMSLKRRQPEEALAWVERGLELEKAQERWCQTDGGLSRRRREILGKLGRVEDALRSAWKDYRGDPSVLAYEELMGYVPEGVREVWQARALSALEGAPLTRQIELLRAAGEVERLAGVVERASRAELMQPSHYLTEPVAEMLEKEYPIVAAGLRVALGLRIVEAKKSRYYWAALRHLQRGRDLLLTAGRDAAWKDLVEEVRASHGAKYSFLPGFERLVAGGRLVGGPSFLERARASWGRRDEGGDVDENRAEA